jgi:hypothetical protein
MADDEQYIQQFLRSRAPDGSEVLREVIHPLANGPLDAGAAQQLEASQGRAFLGFVDPSVVPQLGAQPATTPPPTMGPQAGAQTPPDVAATPAPSLYQQALNVVAPKRSFLSQAPSIAGSVIGGTLGGAAGALTGPFAPVVAPVLALAGAGLGSTAGEALQIAGEHYFGAAPAEAAPVSARLENAGIRGAAGEAGGQLVGAAGQLIARPFAATARAAGEVAPVLEQTAVRGTIRDAAGNAVDLGPLVRDPQALGAFDVHPADQLRLLRGWWNQYVRQGPDALLDAWKTLGANGQAAVAGDHLGAMQTLFATMAKARVPLSWQDYALTGGPLAIAKMFGLGGGLPAAGLGLGLGAAKVLPPKLLTSAIMDPGSSAFLASLPQTAATLTTGLPGVALGLGGRGATQAATAYAWPPSPIPMTPVAPPGAFMPAG